VSKNPRVIKRPTGDVRDKLNLPQQLSLKPRAMAHNPIESPSFLNRVEVTKFGNYNIPHKIVLVKQHSDSYRGLGGNLNNFDDNSKEDLCRKTAYFGK
jgi:hypothetical protein